MYDLGVFTLVLNNDFLLFNSNRHLNTLERKHDFHVWKPSWQLCFKQRGRTTSNVHQRIDSCFMRHVVLIPGLVFLPNFIMSEIDQLCDISRGFGLSDCIGDRACHRRARKTTAPQRPWDTSRGSWRGQFHYGPVQVIISLSVNTAHQGHEDLSAVMM